jgi:hypothetical protein
MKKKEIQRSVRATADIVFEARGLKETDTSILVPTVPLVEGVFSGRGYPALRLYDEFKDSVKWLNGIPVVSNHEALTPDARRVGQIQNPTAIEAEKKARATTEFFKIDLTQRELETIKSKTPINGSLSFASNLEMTPGDYNGIHYDAIERGPYVFYEYSMVRSGVVTPAMGAGFNMECDGCKAKQAGIGESKLKLKSSAHGAMRGQKMSEGQPPATEPELIEEQDVSTSALVKRIESLEAGFKVVQEENKALKEQGLADKKAAALEKFSSKLKPGHLAEAEKLFAEYQKDPATWVMENSTKFIEVKETKPLSGSAITDGAPAFDLAKEQAKIDYSRRV